MAAEGVNEVQHQFRIGELARMARIPPRTIRYYEDVGLLPRARRSGVGYRLYSSVDRERLGLIRRSKLLGLSLRDIKELVGFAMDGNCGHLQQHLLGLLRTRRAEIDRQVEELSSLKGDLYRLELDVSGKLASGESRGEAGGHCSCLEASTELSGAGKS